jgi:RNA polymerase sigma-70 factor (ECF subfamily)
MENATTMPMASPGTTPPASGAVADPEHELLAQLRRGDEAAHETLVRQHGGAMLAVARRLLRNDEDARDAVQEAFLQAFRALPAFRGASRLSTWLHRIVVNTSLMRLRAASHRPETPIDNLLPVFEADGHHAEPVTSYPLGVEEALERAEIRARVRAAVEELPAQYRAAIVLRDFEELSTAETARALGISENAVKTRLHRARQALGTLLRRQLGAALPAPAAARG